MIIVFQYLDALKRAQLDRFTLLYTESDVPLLILYVRSCIIIHVSVTPKQVVIYLKQIHVIDIFFCHFSSPRNLGRKKLLASHSITLNQFRVKKNRNYQIQLWPLSLPPQDASDMAKFHMRIELLNHEKSHSKRK